jgi:hypothetical protein
MCQRIVPFAIPTSWSPRPWRNAPRIGGLFGALLFAVLLVPLAAVHAQTTVNYDFEDGVMRGKPTSMQVPPKIITENGNKFMHITGSKGDCSGIPSWKCPPRNRSTVAFTSHYNSMPLITSANMRQTYSARIRFHDDTGSDGYVFELFQDSPEGETYGAHNGTGPVARFRRIDGHVKAYLHYANETKVNIVDLGAIKPGTFHTYTFKAVWSHDPSVGRLEVFLDGKLKKTITGRDVNLGPHSNRLPMMKLGLYGDYAVGRIDVDNVKAGPSSGGSRSSSPEGGGNMSCGNGCDRSSTRAVISAPTNIRVVNGQ